MIFRSDQQSLKKEETRLPDSSMFFSLKSRKSATAMQTSQRALGCLTRIAASPVANSLNREPISVKQRAMIRRQRLAPSVQNRKLQKNRVGVSSNATVLSRGRDMGLSLQNTQFKKKRERLGKSSALVSLAAESTEIPSKEVRQRTGKQQRRQRPGGVVSLGWQQLKSPCRQCSSWSRWKIQSMQGYGTLWLTQRVRTSKTGWMSRKRLRKWEVCSRKGLMQRCRSTPSSLYIIMNGETRLQQMAEMVVGKMYKLTKKLGSGAFGEIFHAINTSSNSEYAVKLEPTTTKHPQLFYEAKLIIFLHQEDTSTDKGIPQIFLCSSEGEYNVMVMDLLGPSLEDLFGFCGRKFDLKTVLVVAEQILTRIEFVHKKQFLHRDIKPDNFLLGNSKKKHLVYMIDFGLAKKYRQRDGRHIPYRDNKHLTGTARYASVNTHIGIEQGRRDDIESLGYVLIYFLKGSLPWQNLKANNKKDKYERIMEKKLSTSVESLCHGLPVEFKEVIEYARSMSFDQEPEYEMLRTKFTSLFTASGFVRDNQYDWTRKALQKRRKVLEQ